MPDAYEQTRSHPRFQEWLEEQHLLQSNAVPPGQCLGFNEWLKRKKEEESNPLPRPPTIRGDNPPLQNDADARSKRIISETCFSTGLILAVVLFFWGALLGFFNETSGGIAALLIILGIVIAAVAYRYSKKLDLEVKILSLPLPLHLFNTEFTCVFADNSTALVAVFFEVSDALFEKQLNQMAEKELVVFLRNKQVKDISPLVMDTHLRRVLVRFQDENLIRVLRVTVTLTTHLRPRDQPQGGAYL